MWKITRGVSASQRWGGKGQRGRLKGVTEEEYSTRMFRVRYLLPSVLERELCVVIPGFVDGLQFAKYAVARVDIHSAGSVSLVQHRAPADQEQNTLEAQLLTRPSNRLKTGKNWTDWSRCSEPLDAPPLSCQGLPPDVKNARQAWRERSCSGSALARFGCIPIM